MLTPLGYTVIPVAVKGALHLKTAVTYAGRNTVLANPEWTDIKAFKGMRVLEVPKHEPWGASVLDVNGTLILPSILPRHSRCPRARRLPMPRAGSLRVAEGRGRPHLPLDPVPRVVRESRVPSSERYIPENAHRS